MKNELSPVTYHLSPKFVKERRCIGEVIGGYVRLQFRNGKAMGLCPFHDDHHPSLVVDLKKQNFVCYACGAKGDVFSFVGRIENCSFKEALNKLSDNCIMNNNSGHIKRTVKNINKSTDEIDIKCIDKDKINIDYKRIDMINREFINLLMPYIHFNKELIRAYIDFKVGVCPVLVSDKWKIMSDRIIFPIYNDDGYLTGFAGRLNNMDNVSLISKQFSKYINSSASDGFRKSETLYALFQAKEAILKTGEVYLTEGYKDALAMHAAGFVNTVAICSTTLTDGQLFLLQKYRTSRAYLLLDGDKAGQEATAKVTAKLTNAGIESVPIALPEADDPDSLFNRLGYDAFTSYIRKASPSRRDKELELTGKLRILYSSDAPDDTVCLDCEQLLQWIIADLNRSLLRLSGGTEQRDILYQLTHRLEQYTEISHLLNRPGAIGVTF